MIQHLKIIWLLLIPLWLFTSLKTDKQTTKTVSHTVYVNHPGEKTLVEAILNEVKNVDGLPVEYFMDVTSVICLEEVCKVIPVRLFWNNIGDFVKYELEKGATLEKYEDDIFEFEDYNKLRRILLNKNSPFKEVYIDEILTVPDELNDGIDAISGATALELDEKDTVPGAALTCFTLWHWANGSIVSNIKNITGASLSNKQLLDFISKENKTYFNISLQQLKKRNLYAIEHINPVYNRLLNQAECLKLGLAYLETAPMEVYLQTVQKLLSNGKKEQKLSVIRSLNNTKQDIPTTFLDTVSKEFSNLKSFHEVSILLELMQAKNAGSETVINQVLPLLNGDFIAARRVYWFLKNEKLNLTQTKLIQDFYKDHKDRL